jgi:hypothetical protein
MTSTSITGDGRAAIERTINLDQHQKLQEQNNSTDWEIVFEIERCIQWIRDNSFKKVGFIIVINVLIN